MALRWETAYPSIKFNVVQCCIAYLRVAKREDLKSSHDTEKYCNYAWSWILTKLLVSDHFLIYKIIKQLFGGFLGGPVVKTLPSSAGDVGLIPSQLISHLPCSQKTKTQNKTNNNKDFKMVHNKKFFKKKYLGCTPETNITYMLIIFQ